MTPLQKNTCLMSVSEQHQNAFKNELLTEVVDDALLGRLLHLIRHLNRLTSFALNDLMLAIVRLQETDNHRSNFF